MSELFLDKSLHLGKLSNYGYDLKSEEKLHLLQSLIMIDDFIIGVKEAAICPFLKETKIKKIRYGLDKFPEEFYLESDDDFYRMLAVMIPISEFP